MARPLKLTDDAITAALIELEGWERQEDKLHKTFVFADFNEAWGFMSRAALIAEKMDHHPDWSNVYRTVKVDLNTHDVGGITALDIELARAMNRLAL
jgi:4a-hydroxytetrahydrobiopterin dehydratase